MGISPVRKCNTIPNFRNHTNHTNHTNNPNSTNDHDQLINSYGQWINKHISDGWDGYLFTFMFDHLVGSEQAKLIQMKTHLGWFYGRLAKRSVPQASRPQWAYCLPRAVMVPDTPVHKHSKQMLRDVTINDGIHWHGMVLAIRSAPKLQEPLDLHITKTMDKYLVGQIRHIDVQPIVSRSEYVAEYCMKGLKQSQFSKDDIVSFPRTTSELPAKSPLLAAVDRPTYDFQRK
jgi:hypothetical protein